MKIWSWLAADRPVNILSRLAEIRVSISPLLADEQERFATVRAYLRENLWKKKNETRGRILILYFLDLDSQRTYLSASRRIAKVHYATRKFQFVFRGNYACHIYATRLSRNDSRDDCTRIIVRLIIDLERRRSFPPVDRISFIKSATNKGEVRACINWLSASLPDVYW